MPTFFKRTSTVLAMASSPGSGGHAPGIAAPAKELGLVQVDKDIELRRMVYRPANLKGTVLFLHGFPETMYAWKAIAETLSTDYEVHAFDWPGYGQSSRPDARHFSYAPREYARVLEQYIEASGIDKSKLLIYATDIGSLPALLAALEHPDVASKIIVGDFAPFDRPQYMYESLQALKSKPSSDIAHAALNRNRDDILKNSYRRGLPKNEQFDISPEYERDMADAWRSGQMTPGDAFYLYYSHFTRDQDYFEANMDRLKVPVRVVWGDKDFYINKEMGLEMAARNKLPITILPNLGHYPHLQDPGQTVREVRAAFEH